MIEDNAFVVIGLFVLLLLITLMIMAYQMGKSVREKRIAYTLLKKKYLGEKKN